MRFATETIPAPIDALTEPDVMLPAQLLPEQSALTDPERRLRLAVLKDALHYVQRHEHATDEHARALYEDALDWVADPDRSEPFSFENICDALGLDAWYVRSCLRRWQRTLRTGGSPAVGRAGRDGIGCRPRGIRADRRAA